MTMEENTNEYLSSPFIKNYETLVIEHNNDSFDAPISEENELNHLSSHLEPMKNVLNTKTINKAI